MQIVINITKKLYHSYKKTDHIKRCDIDEWEKAIDKCIILPKDKKAVDAVIKALEQEPCEDTISRKAVLEQTYSWSKDEFLRVTNPFYYLRKRIKALPPVTPTQDTRQVARWVNNIHDLPICSKCGNYAVFDHAIDDYYYSDYCPKCGARMENAVEKIYKEDER